MGNIFAYLFGHHASSSAASTSHTDVQSTSSKDTKTYSWDNRPKVDPSLFTVANVENTVVHRLPRTIHGNQFIIQNCMNSHIFIFDATSTVTVDDCTGCKIYLGPVKGSVFVRDCRDCVVQVACQQFRLRDCERLTALLCCTTQPIIESSSHVKFGCFQLNYPELEEQFKQVGLSRFTNNWSDIHDFTPVPQGKNYSFLPPEKSTEEYLEIVGHCQSFIDVSTIDSFVPLTVGGCQKPTSDSCLVAFFGVENYAIQFISRMKEFAERAVLVQTKEVKLTVSDRRRIFSSERVSKLSEEDCSVVGLEYCGDDCCTLCRDVMSRLIPESGDVTLSENVYVSSSSLQASVQIEQFYNVASMQMSV